MKRLNTNSVIGYERTDVGTEQEQADLIQDELRIQNLQGDSSRRLTAVHVSSSS